MNLYTWRHNRRFHSWSMLSEPIIHQAFYADATLTVIATSLEEAYKIVAVHDKGWLVEELKRLTPLIKTLESGCVIHEEILFD